MSYLLSSTFNFLLAQKCYTPQRKSESPICPLSDDLQDLKILLFGGNVRPI